MKKISISILALAIASTSAFAWSKKAENTGNLGRMYISVEGGINTQKANFNGESSSPTGADASIVFNAPVFKPGVNAFRKIKWAGVDAAAFFNYSYSNDFKYNSDRDVFSYTNYTVGAALTPYLNFETTLPVFKAIKPFGIAYAGYSWSDNSGSGQFASSSDNAFVYGVGGGVEIVIIDNLSFTPSWKWNGNAESGVPCYQSISADLSYWFSDQFCFSIFWNHKFEIDDSSDFEVVHGDVIGAKFKIGFMR